MNKIQADRRKRINAALFGRSLDEAMQLPSIREDLVEESRDTSIDAVFTADMLDQLEEIIIEKRQESPASLFFSSEAVIIVPGLMGSCLSDVGPSGDGLIWVSPDIVFRNKLGKLQLAKFPSEADLDPDVEIEATMAFPLFYDLLRLSLEVRRYTTQVLPVDWRKDLENPSRILKQKIEQLNLDKYPVHIVAHSQGALVARRAIQLLEESHGPERTKELVKNLVLLGPAHYGSFSALYALAGTHDMISFIKRLAVDPPQDFKDILGSMTGIYQLLPFDKDRIPWLKNNDISNPSFWVNGIDSERLRHNFAWGKNITTDFFNSNISVILGDNFGSPTSGGAKYQGERLISDTSYNLEGDGTVPHSCAVIPGTRTYLASDTEHSMLPNYRTVIGAIRSILAGKPVELPSVSSDPSEYLQQHISPSAEMISESPMVDDPFQRRSSQDPFAIDKSKIYEFKNKFICSTDSRGYASPKNRTPNELVLDASHRFIPLWKKNQVLMYSFNLKSLTYFRDVTSAKLGIQEIFQKAILEWGDAAPIKFTEAQPNDGWDFEFYMNSNDDCESGGCVLAKSFFPGAGSQQLVLFPQFFAQSRTEQIKTLTHEIGHIFGLRHFFANLRETHWAYVTFGRQLEMTIMEYGSNCKLTEIDKLDLKDLYQKVWLREVTDINKTPIRLFKTYNKSGDDM
jgi:hypothetical protein